MGVFREAYLKDKLFQNSGLEISSNVKHQLVWCLPQININLWSQGKDRYSGSTTLGVLLSCGWEMMNQPI